ncbi:hypothetical protein ACVB8X_40960 [Streptomyces sp. NRAIS4]
MTFKSSFQARVTAGGSRSESVPGVRGFDSGPEQARERARDRVQAAEVQRRLPLPQVVHDQIADRPALDAVAVHQLLDAQLAKGKAECPDRCRGVLREDAQGAQPQIEVVLPLPAAGMHPALGVDELHAVADRDVADESALAGQEGRDACRGDLGVLARVRQPGLGQLAQACEPVGIVELSHGRGKIPVRAGEHPRQTTADDVCADQHEQP